MLAPRLRDVLLVAALGAAAGPQPAQASGTPSLAGPAHCRFVAPQGWPARGVRWTGACRAGFAQGLGTLRAYNGGRVARAFYGRLQAGQSALGVIDQDDGFIAGRFEAGRVLDDGERNTLILAFGEASAAAWQMADGYRRAGNAASARFYENKAKQLSQQMD